MKFVDKFTYTNELCVFYTTTLTEFNNGALTRCVDHYMNNIQTNYKFDLLFYFDQFPRRKRKFFRELNKFKKYKNINNVYIINNEIPDDENFYFNRNVEKLDLNKFPLGGSHGINSHFYISINNLFERSYENCMLLESDTCSVGNDWFDVLHEYSINNEFVIAGSKYKGRNKETVFKEHYGGHHINGVALYKNNYTTKKLIRASYQFLINSLIKDATKSKRHKRCNSCLNYDVAIYLYAKKKNLSHLLHDTNFITNFRSDDDDDTELKTIMLKYPETRIVHKKNLYDEVDIKSTIKILKENSVYRIADLFYMDGNRWEDDRSKVIQSEEYSDTILHDYMLNKTNEFDYDTFKSITLKHSEKYDLKPNEDDLVFHLRLGDVFDINGETRIYNRADWSYLQYKVFFRKNREFLETLNKVKVVTALHFGSDELTGDFYYTDNHYIESMKFFDYFCGRLHDFGCSVDVISNENIDKDICYMMQSTHFVPGLTKLSTLISTCIENDAKLYREPIQKYI